MRGRKILPLSLLLNLVLAALAFSLWHRPPAAAPTPSYSTNTTRVVGTNRFRPFVQRAPFTWDQLESDDYDRYINNLRAIGCPDDTIRDIIVCDVDALYAHRRITDLPEENPEWWRSDSESTNYYHLYSAKRELLNNERTALLTKLLGANWPLTERFVSRSIPEPLPALTGPVLGALGDDVKNSIYDLVEKLREREDLADNFTNRLLATQEFRAQLARLLTPAQLEEYLLRHSDTADELRVQLGNLKYFKTSPDEFRALFRATDGLDGQINFARISQNDAQEEKLNQQRAEAIKLALGPQRYAEYERLQDNDYRNALDLVDEHGGNPQTAAALYAINQATTAEQSQLDSHTNLPPLAAQLEQKKIELAQLQAQAQALGQVAPEPPPAPPAAAPVPMQPHFVATGETGAGIAARYFVKLADLQALNPGVDFSRLKIGQSVNVPAP
jgi:LysM repeat protein